MISIPTNGKSAKPRFPLGQVLATPGALESLEESGELPARFLSRHVVGDWGDELGDDDKALNDEALIDGLNQREVPRMQSPTFRLVPSPF